MALRPGNGLAGAVRTLGRGLYIVPDWRLFLSRAANLESPGSRSTGVPPYRSGAALRPELSTLLSGGRLPRGVCRAVARAHVGPARSWVGGPGRSGARPASGIPRGAVPRRNAPAHRDRAPLDTLAATDMPRGDRAPGTAFSIYLRAGCRVCCSADGAGATDGHVFPSRGRIGAFGECRGGSAYWPGSAAGLRGSI